MALLAAVGLLALAGLLVATGLDLAGGPTEPIGPEAATPEPVGEGRTIAVVIVDDRPDDDSAGNDRPEESGHVDDGATGGRSEGWAPLTVFDIVDPAEHGAVGDGRTDDTAALQRAVDTAGRAGAIVVLRADRRFLVSGVIRVTGDGVKLWAPSGKATILSRTGEVERHRAILVDGADRVGLFGFRYRTDADRRLTALEDSAIAVRDAEGTEIVGLDVSGSPSAAIIVFDAYVTWVEGNLLHDNHADGIHFTDGSRDAWAWGNTISAGEPAGDDGIACVTYGSGDRCGRMEWWHNRHLGNGWGRGLAVIGGIDIDIHHNLVRGTAGAGIIVASEPSFDAPGSDGISIRHNVVVGTSHAIPHPGILLSGLDGAIVGTTLIDNAVVDTVSGEPFRIEGQVEAVDESGLVTELPAGPLPASGRPERRDTAVLATRDTAAVDPVAQAGLYRVHVRLDPDTGAPQQRFEYVVAGPSTAVDSWLAEVGGQAEPVAGTGGEVVAVVLSPTPLRLGFGLRAVDFGELRRTATDRPELWSLVDAR